MSVKDISANIAGAEWKFETGKLAGQANGAVTARLGDTVVLATAVMSKNLREGMGFSHCQLITKKDSTLQEKLKVVVG